MQGESTIQGERYALKNIPCRIRIIRKSIVFLGGGDWAVDESRKTGIAKYSVSRWFEEMNFEYICAFIIFWGMDYFLTSFEILLDAFTWVLGVVLFFKAKDNRFRRNWGFLVFVLSSVMLYENSCWLFFPLVKNMEDPLVLLSFSRMLKYYILAHVFSLFPIGSLRPGWLTPQRLLLFWLPPLLATAIVLCYIWFNGYCTPLFSLEEVSRNISQQNVQLRVGLFVLSLVSPVVNYLIPFIGKEGIYRRRRLTTGMYVYSVCVVLIMWTYIFFTLTPNWWLFEIYGFVILLLPVSISILSLRRENPLSAPPETDEVSLEELEVSPVVYDLYLKMLELMRTKHPYASRTYTIRQLCAQLEAKQKYVVRAIRYAGFTGFQEYIDFLRLEYFKELILLSPEISLPDLIAESGFASQSKFYREFTKQEKMTPEEFIELSR